MIRFLRQLGAHAIDKNVGRKNHDRDSQAGRGSSQVIVDEGMLPINVVLREKLPGVNLAVRHGSYSPIDLKSKKGGASASHKLTILKGHDPLEKTTLFEL